DKGESGRLLTGRVTDKQEAPIAGAVVYLSNTRTRAVKTFIAGQDGIYRFPALSPSIDYEVYAQFDGHKSDTKTVSQFDTHPPVLEAGCLYASTSVREASSPTARILSPTFFSSWFILMILKSCSWPGSR